MNRHSRFATYLHPETTATTRPPETIAFVGYSWPHFAQIRQALAERTVSYPVLPLRIAPLDTFSSVHTAAYLEQLQRMAEGIVPDVAPRLSAECQGLEHCLPGYRAGLGGMLEAIDQMRDGNLDRAYCFSLGGHHAYADGGPGYCLLNPQAAAVHYAQAHGFSRVVIVDWDIHHGDGTQAIFAGDRVPRRLFGTSRGRQMFYYRIRKLNSCDIVRSIGAKIGRNSLALSHAE
jgi:acetoin utilization deacetylase AcuC-like enzyme